MNRKTKNKKPKIGCWIVAAGFLALFSLTALGAGIWLSQLRRHHLIATRLNSGDYFFFTTPRSTAGKYICDLVGEKAFDTIESANLKGSQGRADLRYLARKPGFKFLGLQGKDFDDKDMACVGRMRDLVDLSLASVNVSSQGIAELKHCGNLRSVSMLGKWFDDKSLDSLSQATQIQSLYVEDASITRLGKLRTLNQLKTLTLSDCQGLSGNGLMKLTTLESLTLTDTPVNAEELASLTQLREITIEGTSWSKGMPEALAGMDNVQTLAIAGCPLTDEDLSQIARMKNLQTLAIEISKITKAGLERLLEHPQLQTVAVTLDVEFFKRPLTPVDVTSEDLAALNARSTHIEFQEVVNNGFRARFR